MTDTRLFGSPSFQNIKAAQEAGFHRDNMYFAVLDSTALWDLTALDRIIKDFPSRLLDESNLFLVLCECIANAAMHGNAAALGFHARQRDDVLLLSFFLSGAGNERGRGGGAEIGAAKGVARLYL